MKILSIEEYNTQVKAVYPQDWAQISKSRGVVCVTDDFKFGAWGITEVSARNKVMRFFKGRISY